MDDFYLTENGDSLPEFTLAEIKEMQSLFKEFKEKSLSQEFCEEIALRFSCSAHRSGKSTIKWEQVQSWFLDKQKQLAAKVTTSAGNFNLPSRTINASERPKKPIGERIASLSELAFEAKSAKDCAWYDVAAFLNFRVLCTGELEVRVRFAGFSYDQDEWINVKRGIRERSIPLEPSECHRVKVGDLVLCYRENDDHALYSDAYIMDIQKKAHDIRGCRCIFVVRFDYDNTEGKVPLTSICCRPT